MIHQKKIEIYKIIENINTPVAINPTQIANSSIGDYLVIIDDEVWVKNWDDNKEEQFAKAIYSSDFVKLNDNIFEKVA